MIRRDQMVRPHPQVVDTELGEGKTALLHLDDKIYFSLNATGTKIWRELKEGKSLEEISRSLQAEYDVDAAQAEQSVLELVNELLQQKLVQVAD